jgi:hypothetical protein
MNLDPNMNTRTKFCLTAAGASAAAIAGGASAAVETITFSIGGDYTAGSVGLNSIGSSTNIAWAGATMLTVEWSSISWSAADNRSSGASFSNWTNELRMGLTSASGSYGFGAPGGGSSTGFASGGSVGAFDISSSSYIVGASGTINTFGYSSYNDGAGLIAGTILGGTFTITIDTIDVPAPGAIALLGLAGVVGARRRRMA